MFLNLQRTPAEFYTRACDCPRSGSANCILICAQSPDRVHLIDWMIDKETKSIPSRVFFIIIRMGREEEDTKRVDKFKKTKNVNVFF